MTEPSPKPKRDRKRGGFRVCAQQRAHTGGSQHISLTPISPEFESSKECRRWIIKDFQSEEGVVREGNSYAIVQVKEMDIRLRTETRVSLT